MRHVVITRFNMPFPGGKYLDRDWLRQRFDLCDMFCFPSLRTQTCREFSWLILFHMRLPVEFYDRIAYYAVGVDVIPHFTTKPDPIGMRRALCEHWETEPEWIITTRLDSDDALSRDHIERVQNAAQAGRREFLEFPRGWVWSEGNVTPRTYPKNPFLSLVEPFDGFQTAYCVPHPRAADAAPVRTVDDRPAWLQVVHGGNVSNRVPRASGDWRPAEALLDTFSFRLAPTVPRIAEPRQSESGQ